MNEYQLPFEEMRFAIKHTTSLSKLQANGGFPEVSYDLIDAILEEAGKFGTNVLGPLNRIGDQQGSVLKNGTVQTPDGFSDAYHQFVEMGWNGIAFSEELGGQNLPWSIAIPICEIWQSANLGFSLCPVLTQGAVEALSSHASLKIKELYLPKLVSGEWTGTMNITESQAGSDLARLRSKATPEGDAYRISGQKIFISYGDHEMTENVIHLVLARLPDAPAGVKGISLFLVPKYILDEEGKPGERNDVSCVSLEHKMGIHASPTAVMSFGDKGGALGYLIGEENSGLACMFTMMNNARLNIAVQGLGVSDRACQQASAYAKDRKQGRRLGNVKAGPDAIIHHPDVKRMLLSMRSQTEAARAILYFVAGCMDYKRCEIDKTEQLRQQGFVDLLTPVAKALATDFANDITSTNIQVHGGMGYIEETGAAQLYRDARITAIYEGTNGIQSIDLVGRKVGHDGGKVAVEFIEHMRQTMPGTEGILSTLPDQLEEGFAALEQATNWIVENWKTRPEYALAGSVPYLRLFGVVTGGWLMALQGDAAQKETKTHEGDIPDFLASKILSVRFFGDHQLSQAKYLAGVVCDGAEAVVLAEENNL